MGDPSERSSSILVVESDWLVGGFLSEALVQLGYAARCERTGDTAWCPSELALNQFAARHAGHAGYYGAGDLVERATHALGLEQCAPCAAQQAWLNRAVPRAWRR